MEYASDPAKFSNPNGPVGVRRLSLACLAAMATLGASTVNAQTFSPPVEAMVGTGNPYAAYNSIDDRPLEYHTGRDIKSADPRYANDPKSTPVFVAADGVVAAVFRTDDTVTYCDGLPALDVGTGNRGLGNAVIIDHENGLYSLYGHLDCVMSNITQGERVADCSTGCQLGRMGNSTTKRDDSDFGPHLHFEIKQVGKLGDRWDPDTPFNVGYVPDVPDGYGYIAPETVLATFEETSVDPTVIQGVNLGTQTLRVRACPDVDTCPIIGRIKAGQQFVAHMQHGDWYRIHLPNAAGAISGWVAGRHAGETLVEEATRSVQGEVVDTGTNCNIMGIAFTDDERCGLRVRNSPAGEVLRVPAGDYGDHPDDEDRRFIVKIWDGQRFSVRGQAVIGGMTWYKIDLTIPYPVLNPTAEITFPVSGWVSGEYFRVEPLPNCGQPVTDGVRPMARDCLSILLSAVGQPTCELQCTCDVTGDRQVTASDALSCLRRAVGQPIELACHCPDFVCGMIVDELLEAEPTDVYDIAASEGDVIAVAVGEASPDSSFRPSLLVTDGDGTELASCSGFSGCGTPRLKLTGPPPYTIAVFDEDMSLGPFGADYNLSVAPISDAFAGQVICTDMLGCDTAMPAAVMLVNGDVDSYRLTATEGDVIAVAVGEASPDSSFRPSLLVTDGDGTELTSCSGFSGCGTPRLKFTGPPPYTITVFDEDFSPSPFGADYNLSVAPISDAFAGQDACVEMLGCDTAMPAAVMLVNGGVDSYRLTANEGDVIAVAVGEASPESSFKPSLLVTDGDGTELASCSDITACGTPRLKLTGPPPYTITVFDEDFSPSPFSADYNLSVAPISDAFAGQDDCVETIGYDTPMPVVAALVNGGLRSYRLSAQPGDIVDVTISEISPDGVGWVQPSFLLSDGNGLDLASCSGNSACSVAGVTLTGPAPYTITMFDEDFFTDALGQAVNCALSVNNAAPIESGTRTKGTVNLSR